MKTIKVLTEAAGSPVWPALYHWLRQAKMVAIPTDIDPLSIGFYLTPKAYLVPKNFSEDFFHLVEKIILRENISIVFPALNEGLMAWSERKEHFQKSGVSILISEPETIRIFVDKWQTYQFFLKAGIPTPETSLSAAFDLVKPRIGRGGEGIRRVGSDISPFEMTDKISQRFIAGKEFSIDALCDLKGFPLYVVPRERLKIESGISFRGRVVKDEEIERYVHKICSIIKFMGPVNFQCIRNHEGIYFTEVNPRISGGLALTLAATTNWFALIRQFLEGKKVKLKAVRYGLTMIRYFTEHFVPQNKLIHENQS